MIGLGSGGTVVTGAVVSSCGTFVHGVGLRCSRILVEDMVSSCGVRLVPTFAVRVSWGLRV